MGALLRTDVPQLKNLLMDNEKAKEMIKHAMVVTRQAAIREKEAEKVRKQEESGVMPHSLVPAKEIEKTQSMLDSTLEEEDWMLQIEEDVLGEPKNHPEKLQLSCRQKCRNNREYIAMKEVKQAGYERLAGNLEKFKQLQVKILHWKLAGKVSRMKPVVDKKDSFKGMDCCTGIGYLLGEMEMRCLSNNLSCQGSVENQ